MNITCPISRQKCYNSIGSYYCACPSGYSQVEGSCVRKYIYDLCYHEKGYEVSFYLSVWHEWFIICSLINDVNHYLSCHVNW